MSKNQIHLLLAEDDADDRQIFEEVLTQLPIAVRFTSVHNGEQLIGWLKQQKDHLPHLLFLDLNMPLKDGYECLLEIKKDPQLQSLPVFIFSTTADPNHVENLYKNGAQYYIQKPSSYTKLLQVIEQIINMPEEKKRVQPEKRDFIFFRDH